MCMLFAFSASSNFKINAWLKNFFGFSTFHPHGWGMAAYDKDKNLRLIKDKTTANKSGYLKEILNKRIVTKIALAHIRYATAGEVSYNNAHPFRCKINNEEWVFAHNGSVNNEVPNLYISPEGETDSERVFCYLQQRLLETGAIKLEQKIEVIEECIKKFSKGSKLNLIISDGTYLYAHCNLKKSLFVYKDEEFIFFSTRPLADVVEKDKWEPVGINKLVVYKENKIVFEGKEHGNEYFNNKYKR